MDKDKLFNARELLGKTKYLLSLLDDNYEVTLNKRAKGLYDISYKKVHKVKKTQ